MFNNVEFVAQRNNSDPNRDNLCDIAILDYIPSVNAQVQTHAWALAGHTFISLSEFRQKYPTYEIPPVEKWEPNEVS